MKTLILTVLVIGLILLSACASPSATPTPAPTPEPAIRSHYTTYTDTNIFSISYPPEWEEVKVQEYMEKALEASGSDSSPEAIEDILSVTLFMAGVPTGKGYYSPHVTVIRIPFAGKELKLDDLVEAVIRDAKDTHEEFKVLLRIRTTVDNREGVIIEVETETYYPGMERARQIQMITLKDNTIWIVTCTSQVEDSGKYKDDFYNVVKSLRILK